MSTTEWINASASGGGGGTCVEMRRHGEAIQGRDSKDPDGPVLRFTAREFATWLDGAKHAEFDHLLSD